MKKPFLLICVVVTASALCLMSVFFLEPQTGQSDAVAERDPPQAVSSAPARPFPPAKKEGPNLQVQIASEPSVPAAVSESAVNAAIDAEIDRLRGPCERLFQKWGLEKTATQKFLAVYKEKIETRAKDPSSNDFSATRSGKNTSTADLDSEIIQIVGGTGRFYELNTLITQTNLLHYKAGQKQRDETDEYFSVKFGNEVTELKKKYGAGYEDELRKKYGDQTAASILKLVDRFSD